MPGRATTFWVLTSKYYGDVIVPRHEKIFAYAKTKAQISFAVNAAEADQRLCFRYTDSTVPLLPKSEFSSF